MQLLNLRFPKIILNFFINVLNEKDVFDQSNDGKNRDFMKQMSEKKVFDKGNRLSFHKLRSFQNIFNRCPMFTAQTNNSSQNFKNALSTEFNNYT